VVALGVIRTGRVDVDQLGRENRYLGAEEEIHSLTMTRPGDFDGIGQRRRSGKTSTSGRSAAQGVGRPGAEKRRGFLSGAWGRW